MKRFRKLGLAAFAIMIILFTSCQVGSVNNADTEINNVNTELFGDISVLLPSSRGWNVTKYKVTASRTGESDVSKETSSSSLKMRLKVGAWSFAAEGYDENNNLVYKTSAPKSAIVKIKENEPFLLILESQSFSVSYTFNSTDAVKGLSLDKITLVGTTTEFDDVSADYTNISVNALLNQLLRSKTYNITVVGYKGNTEYARATWTQTSDGYEAGKTLQGGQKYLEQTKVTPLSVSEPNGTYFNDNTKTVELSSDTDGITIYYTLDGTTPNTSSAKYSGPITIFNGTNENVRTLKAIAVKSGMDNSEIITAEYHYNFNQAATPTFTPQGGEYSTDQHVVLSTTENGTIKYTLDGSAPGSSSATYSDPIDVVGDGTVMTIRAKVIGVDGKTDSAAVSQTYTISYSQLSKPMIIVPDPCDTAGLFTLSSPDGADIYYTKDGSDPTTSSTKIKYIEPFTLTAGSQEIKAFCQKTGWKNSSIETKTCTVIEHQNDGINLANATELPYQNEVWSLAVNLTNGINAFWATNFTAGKTYELTWGNAALSGIITLYADDIDHTADIERTENKVIWTATAGVNKYYPVLNMTAAESVTLVITEHGNEIPVTAITIRPNTGLAMTIGDVKTFNVLYTPSNANVGLDITWAVSDSDVLSVSNAGVVTAIAAGSSKLTATLTSNNIIKDDITIDVVNDVVNNTLGFMHPETGVYSQVDESSWATATYPLGANVSGGNTTFALYSANATKVLLEIYDQAYGADAKYDYWMTQNTTTKQWQAKLSGNLTGAMYAFRVWGPNWTFDNNWTRGGNSAGCVGNTDYDDNGNRFNPNKIVFDPYAREITHDPSNASALADSAKGYNVLSTGDSYRNLDSGKYAPKGYVITDSTDYGTKPQIAQKDAIIYEAHVRGITKHSSAANLQSLLSGYEGFENVVDIPDEYRGTYKGAAMLVPYLKALGINTIELLPVHETDNDANPDNGPGGNFWGYMTFDYFAPDRRYSSDKTAGGPTREFKEMVKAFHDAGMEVYLDVVYNHSGEGGTWHGSDEDDNYDEGKQCTIVSMRGIDNATYYSLVPATKWSYWENTGCGNNLQCDNTYVRQFILDSLTYWIDTMGVDGFRFDLAPVLGREGTGSWAFNGSAATITEIASLGTSKNVEMIAEAWDCSGSFVGGFPSGWGEWNGNYRDAVRAFIGNATDKDGITYTREIYGDKDGSFGTTTHPSVNFICAHDGFTLADLCSYSGSGNWYNSRRDWPFGPSDGGNSDQNNISTNITINDVINEPASRRQRARNYIAFQMFSAGIPMIVYGDELCRTQNGNNNPYNLDSVATWNNYAMAATSSPQTASTGSDGNAECGTYENMFGTYNNNGKNGQLIFSSFVMNERLNNESLRQIVGDTAMSWYSIAGTAGWADEDNKKAIMINGSGGKYYMMINMTGDYINFTVPSADSGKEWCRIVDTGAWAEPEYNCWSSEDINAYSITTSKTYGVGAYTIVVFKERTEVQTCATPIISSSNNANEFDGGSITITIAGGNGTTIYYTTDGTKPTKESDVYSEPFEITKTTTVKAFAVKSGCKDSEVGDETFTNTAVCNDPVLSVPAGDFWNEITVFVSGTDTYYYTTDGTDPTTSSTAYTEAGIDISATTTLKVLAHDTSSTKGDAVVEAVYTLQSNPSITEDASGVMLQGFNWDSAPRGVYNDENPSPYWYRWYNVVTARANDIKNRFEYLWCPPPSKTDTASSEGYAPTQLNDLNNCYGTAAELQNMITAISPTKAIADIVINHRAGSESWGDFTNPKWCDDYYAICSDDEGFSSSGSPMYGSAKHGAADTGDGYAAYRDLDHTSPVVQKGIYSWMNSVLKRAGFVGWRYDYVKGYGSQYVGYYNAKTSAAFSVGEYWVDSDAVSLTTNWITGTAATLNGTAGQQSRAFDFPLKEKLDSIFGYTGSDKVYHEGWNPYSDGYGSVSYSSLASGGLIHQTGYNNLAVTFVDNHDTGSTQKHRIMDERGVAPSYVYLLTHPGMPCVAWQHYFSYEDSGSMGTDAGEQYIGGKTVPSMTITYKELIDTLIEIRKSAGITTTSTVETISVTGSDYVVKVHGTNHDLIVKIGNANYTPTAAGYAGNLPVLKCDATKNEDNTVHSHGFAVWEYGKTWSDYHTGDTTDVYFYNSDSWATVTAHAWNADGDVYTNWPGAVMTVDTGSWYKLTIPSTATNVIFSNNGSDTGKIETTFSLSTPVYKDGAWYDTKANAEAGIGGSITITVNCKWDDGNDATGLWDGGAQLYVWVCYDQAETQQEWIACTQSSSSSVAFEVAQKPYKINVVRFTSSTTQYNWSGQWWNQSNSDIMYQDGTTVYTSQLKSGNT